MRQNNMKIIAFGASYSKNSINREFASFAARQFDGAEIEILDLNNYRVPLFTVDEESEIGFPDDAKRFINKLGEADLFIISLAEHNGSYTAAFKNLFDWASRLNMKMFEGKKMLLLSTSPGQRGGSGVMGAAAIRFPKHGADIIATFSLPDFKENFDSRRGILNDDLDKKFKEEIALVKSRI